MDVERGLLSKIVAEHDIQTVVEARVTTLFFEDDICATVFAWMLDYYQRYNEAPTETALRMNFPTFKKVRCNEPLAFYIDELREQREYAIVAETLATAGTALKGNDSATARKLLAQGLVDLENETSVVDDLNLASNSEQRLQLYQTWRDLPSGLRGIPSGFPTIDRALLGFQPRQLITITGLPKSGKSTLLLLCAMTAQREAYSSAFLGFEMTNEEQHSRYDAWRAKLDYNKLMSGRLNPVEQVKLERSLRESENLTDLYLVADPSGTATVNGVAAKVEQHDPDIVFIDGVYMMDSELPNVDPISPAALTFITRSLKRLAQKIEKPIVATTQSLPGKYSRRLGLTMEGIGYTSSFAQDSDAIIGLEQTDDPEIMKLSIIAARNARKQSVMVRWAWETAEFEELDGQADVDIPSAPAV